jgi:hypothetical protein
MDVWPVGKRNMRTSEAVFGAGGGLSEVTGKGTCGRSRRER